jgi:hypothetical protein
MEGRGGDKLIDFYYGRQFHYAAGHPLGNMSVAFEEEL